jgi:tRNA threonylcarbamoyladenosine biosynthesis protein TsaB
VDTLKILALDTSTEYCSAALWLDGALRFDGCHAGQRHSQLLLPMIRGLLERSAVKLAECDAIAFGEGPGSFTGLRIACGVAQGLAFGAGLRVIGVGTLVAMAHAVQASQVLCCLDARMHEVYAAAYRRAGERWDTVLAPGLFSAAAMPQLPGCDWTGCGNGFSAYAETLQRVYGNTLADIRADMVPNAREIAILAADAFARDGGKAPHEALPLYIRDKVALTIEEQH